MLKWFLIYELLELIWNKVLHPRIDMALNPPKFKRNDVIAHERDSSHIYRITKVSGAKREYTLTHLGGRGVGTVRQDAIGYIDNMFVLVPDYDSPLAEAMRENNDQETT